MAHLPSDVAWGFQHGMPPSLGVLSYLTNTFKNFKTLKHFKTYIYLLMNYEAYALYG